jgi:hypothetical protein
MQRLDLFQARVDNPGRLKRAILTDPDLFSAPSWAISPKSRPAVRHSRPAPECAIGAWSSPPVSEEIRGRLPVARPL